MTKEVELASDFERPLSTRRFERRDRLTPAGTLETSPPPRREVEYRTHISDQCTAYNMWSVLYDLVDGIEDMRRRGAIDEASDDQFLDAKLAEARRAMKAYNSRVPPEGAQ